ncbi:hypothetical protein GGS23DRAFT_600814 [Durotheca rogersii]|uniref:uncharacterized protein n=1 Tax=Durotheca rogersii TaxID=419775 RepID=UPI00222005BB|nr:uncharacterized protein GGS23DRAFT_600814 [Durotheca rogersii]KAI5857481.1 hypothetical protein GGS23DRAFT_600814 [Durotheca rogersii]
MPLSNSQPSGAALDEEERIRRLRRMLGGSDGRPAEPPRQRDEDRIARRRGQVWEEQPGIRGTLSVTLRPHSEVRGANDEDIPFRLLLLRLAARARGGAVADADQVDLASRVYTQLKLEGSPMIHMSEAEIRSPLPKAWHEQLYRVAHEQYRQWCIARGIQEGW